MLTDTISFARLNKTLTITTTQMRELIYYKLSLTTIVSVSKRAIAVLSSMQGTWRLLQSI